MSRQTLLAAWRLERSQWLAPARRRAGEERRLRALVGHAATQVPFYRERFRAAGLAATDVGSSAELRHLPVTTKAELLAAGEAALAEPGSRPAARPERTSGSSGQPFTVWHDASAIAHRDALFLRALRTAGWRPGARLFLLTGRRSGAERRLLRWRYASIEDPPEKVLAEYRQFRPKVLYGCATALRQLALAAVAESPPGSTAGARVARPLHRPAAVISTAETLDSATRGLLAGTFGAPVFDVYGATETGVISFECPTHAGFHLAADASIVELLPGQGSARRVVVTPLAGQAMPFLRYDTGDLAVPAAEGPCACGRSLPRLLHVEGRAADEMRLGDGRAVSPYRLTCALERVAGIRRYQVVQHSSQRVTLRLESPVSDGAARAAVAALREVLGEGVQLELRREPALEPPLGHKFRVVESQV